MERYQIHSLFRSPFGRLLAFILLIFTVVPVMSVVVFGAITIREQLEDRSVTQMQTVADLNQSSIAQWVTTASNSLQGAIDDPVVAQNALFALQSNTASRSTQVLVDRLTALTKTGYFAHIYFVRPNGEVVLSTVPDLKAETLGINVGELYQNNQHYWGFSDEPNLGYTTAFTWRPVHDRRQIEVGYLVGEFSLSTIADLLRQSGIGAGRTVNTHLVDSDGIEITPNSKAQWSSETIINLIQNNGSYSGLFIDPYGKGVVGTIQVLSGSLQAWLVVTQNETEAFQLLSDATPIAVGFVISLTVLAILVALPTTQRIINPLQNLQRAAQDMARGDLKTRVDIRRQDEFGFLAHSFNQMANELQSAFARLENSNLALVERAEQLASITRVGQLATQFLELDDLLATVTSEIQQVFNYQAVMIYLLENDSLIARAAAGSYTEKESNQVGLAYNAPISISLVERRTIVVNHGNELQSTSYTLHPDIKSEVNIPLLLGAQEERLIGILSIQSTLHDAFGDDEIEVLQILARQLAISIRNAELFNESEDARHIADLANQQKSEFLSNMSHELRTPLNVIIGYSHSMLNRPAMYQHTPLPEVYAQAIESVMTSGQHLLGLINDILDLSKIEAGRIDLEIKSINPLPILTGVRATALGLVKEGVNVYTNYPEKLPHILGDELRVRQILLNLVSNAAKFTDQGAISLGARIHDSYLLFSVADTGTGIPDDAQQDLFDRFKQVSGQNIEVRSLGSGLGLSISRELTRLQGGEIWLDSKVGEGTIFYFTIPLALVPKEEIVVDLAVYTGERQGRVSVFMDEQGSIPPVRQILLVDPRAETRKLIYNALSGRNYNVVVAHPIDDDVLTLVAAIVPDVLVLHMQEASDEMEQLAANLNSDENLTNIPLLILRNASLTDKAAVDGGAIEEIFAKISDLIEKGSSMTVYNQG